MKYLNFTLSVIIFVLALWLTIMQSMLTHSMVVVVALLIITAIIGCLVNASWKELKDNGEDITK